MYKRLKINIQGLVQGVGFRPFIYRTAEKYGLKGFVLNSPMGVDVEIEGEEETVYNFLSVIKEQYPPLASITAITAGEVVPNNYTQFEIRKSSAEKTRNTLISPDFSICNDCLNELFEETNRRYRYPFITCTNCGPRYTTIFDIPYDRISTTMNVFEMCSDCRAEYENPLDRRFHSQTNACSQCGPTVYLSDNNGNIIEEREPVEKAVGLLKQGKIIAVKGLGGFHLLCDAENNESVSLLRKRKHREEKPFAILADNSSDISEFVYVSDDERCILESREKPIVLLQKKDTSIISDLVAPDNDYLGVLLPYTPLHYLLIRNNFRALVDTSGNISDEPITINNQDASNKLSGVADYFLMHNRDIFVHCDDSVYMVYDKKPYPVRRARGFTPFPVKISKQLPGILGCGGEIKNTFCLIKGDDTFISQHIGDLESISAYEHYQESIEHYKHVLDIEPEVIAYDLHPRYLSTQFALETESVDKIGVQHHHAHIAACMAENGVDNKVIGLSLDGTGYGTDGTIWGGEILLCDLNEFERIGYIDYAPLPGGEKAIKDVWRIGLSYLYKVFENDVWNLPIQFIRDREYTESRLVVEMIEKEINSPQTSSLGRLFDGVSSLIGIRDHVSYEGQAAIELESSITMTPEKGGYSFEIINNNGIFIVSYDNMIRSIVQDLERNIQTGTISLKFHLGLIHVFVDVCRKARTERGLNKVALSGGCFQNMFLLKFLKKSLAENGFEVIHHTKVPANDGGISLGQAVIAGNKYLRKRRQ